VGFFASDWSGEAWQGFGMIGRFSSRKVKGWFICSCGGGIGRGGGGWGGWGLCGGCVVKCDPFVPKMSGRFRGPPLPMLSAGSICYFSL